MLDQLELDTSTADISPAFVQSGKVNSPNHLRAAAKDASDTTIASTPTAYTLAELDDVFEQLGRGELEPAQRGALAQRAAMIIAGLRTQGDVTKVTAENSSLQPMLMLAKEGELAAVIQEQPSQQNNGVMKIRVPFYVGGSLASTPSLPGKRLHFGADKLPAIIAEGRRQIAESKQPITVYARHAHAASADKLPVGKVIGLEQVGGIGYVIEAIAPTADGRDVQTLARNGMLNAVSLRSGGGRYDLERVLINGEEAFDVQNLRLDGVDFAPDGPAQPTFGIEVLTAEARIEPMPKISTRSKDVLEDITLEAVRGKTDIMQAIEAPFKAVNEKLTQELTEVKASLAEKTAALEVIERESYVRELAARFPEPEKALGVIQELCKDVKTKEAIAAKVMPLLLDALKNKPMVAEEPKPTANPFIALFPGSGSGNPNLNQELKDGDKKIADGTEVVTGLAVPA